MSPEEIAAQAAADGWALAPGQDEEPAGWTLAPGQEAPAEAPPSGPHSVTIPTTTLTAGSTAAPTSGEATREDYVAVQPPPVERSRGNYGDDNQRVQTSGALGLPTDEGLATGLRNLGNGAGLGTSQAAAMRAFQGLTMGWGRKLVAGGESLAEHAGIMDRPDEGTLDPQGHVRRGPESFREADARAQADAARAMEAAHREGAYGQLVPEIADFVGAIPSFFIPAGGTPATVGGRAAQLGAMGAGYGAVRAAGETPDALSLRGAMDTLSGANTGAATAYGLGAAGHVAGELLAPRIARPAHAPETTFQRAVREGVADPQRVRAGGAGKRDLELMNQRLSQRPMAERPWSPEGEAADPRHVELLAEPEDAGPVPDVRMARRLPAPANERHVRSDMMDAMHQPVNGETQREVALPADEQALSDIANDADTHEVTLPEYAQEGVGPRRTRPEDAAAITAPGLAQPMAPRRWSLENGYEAERRPWNPDSTPAQDARDARAAGTKPIRNPDQEARAAGDPWETEDWTDLPPVDQQARAARIERMAQTGWREPVGRPAPPTTPEFPGTPLGLADTHQVELPTETDTVLPVTTQPADARIARMGQVPGGGTRQDIALPEGGPYREAPPQEQPMREPPPGPEQPRGTFVNETADSIRRHQVQGIGRPMSAQARLSQAAADDAGERMAAHLDALADARGGVVLTSEEAQNAILRNGEVRAALASHVSEQRAPFARRLREAMAAIQESGGLTPSGFRQMLRELSAAAKYDRRALAQPPGSIESARALRAALVDAGDQAMQRYGAPDAARGYRQARVDFGTMQQSADLADQRAAGNVASHMIPLGVGIATEAGAAMGGHSGSGAIGAAAMGAGAYGLQREGPQLLARGAEGVAGMTGPGVGIPGAAPLARSLRSASGAAAPSAGSAIVQAMRRITAAATSGDQQAAAANFAAQMTDPWYRSAAQEEQR